MSPLFLTALALAAFQDPFQPPPPAPAESDGAIRRFGTTRFRHPENLTALALSPDGRLMATGDSKNVKIWDVESGKELQQFAGGGRSLAFSKDGAQLAAGDKLAIIVVDSSTGNV